MPDGNVTVNATFQPIPATAPTIVTQLGDLSLTYGYTTGNVLSVAASAAEGHTISYQWYSNTSASNTGGTAIDDATEESYTVPTGKAAGTTEYYYCVVTAARTDNSQTAETASNAATVSIGKAPLTVTAKPKTITYGDEPTNDGVEYSGFVNNETESVLGGTLGYDYSYTQYGDVGNSYTITPKGLTSDNYEISFAAGTLTVEQKEVGLEWSSTALTFNGSAQVPTATATGTVNGDTISVTVSGGQTDAGTGYTATASGLTGTKAGNYKLPSANTATFAIGKAASRTLENVTASQVYSLTSVSASVAGKMPDDAGSLTYAKGTESKTGSVTVSGWNVDNSGTVTATISGGAAGDTVTLPITIGSTNYADSTINVFVTLTAKQTQTITAENVTATYGDTGKSVSATTDGDGTLSYAVKSGDAVTVDASSGALNIVKAGTATVTVTASETAAYEQATKDVIVTVNKAASTVTKTPTAKNLTYTGQAQALVTAGEATGGEMQYALGDANSATQPYTTSIPAKTDAGTYYVWYKVKGDLNHYDSEPRCVTVNIANALYTVTSVENWEHTIDYPNDIIITVKRNAADNITYSMYTGASVDGNGIPAGGSSVAQGSLILTLKGSYLDTLSTGTHKVTISFKDGSADASISIVNAPPAPTAAPTHVPKTGDGANLVLWIGLILLGFLGIIAFAGMAGRKHRNR